MRIWVDADACPKVIKDILFSAAARTKTALVLVSNHALTAPPSPYISKMQVLAGFDVADDRIMKNIESGDLVITADIPLAAAVIEKNAHVINPRGELYTKDNIRQRLSMRNFSADLRGTGVRTGGPAPLGKRDVQAFANSLDKLLTRLLHS